MIMRVFVA